MPARLRSRSVPALAALGAACFGGSPGGPDPARVPEGVWGGRGIRLEVGAQGAAVEFDCAHGAMEGLELDVRGRFEVAGTYTREQPGPVSPPGPAPAPARYEGGLAGNELTLEVELESGDRIGPYSLLRGEPGRLVKCL